MSAAPAAAVWNRGDRSDKSYRDDRSYRNYRLHELQTTLSPRPPPWYEVTKTTL